MTPAGEELERIGRTLTEAELEARAQRGALRWGWVATMFAGLALGVLLGQLVLHWGT